MMKTICLSLLFAVTACSKKEPTCEDIYDHTLSLMPAELKDKVSGSKEDGIKKCEKMSPEAKSCAMDASSMEDLMKCPRK